MKRPRFIYIALPVLALVLVGVIWFVRQPAEPREEIVITMPYTENIRSIDTNYYKLWLEEQTGLSIQFNIIQENQTADYLRAMFSSGYVKSDAFFSMLDGEDYAGWSVVLQEFGEKGYIIPLNDYVEESVYLNKIFDGFAGYDLREAMTSPDGNIYYMPGFDPSIAQSHFQVMWLNESWLKKLDLEIPQTTEELRAVLRAFKTGNPNGNRLADEIPLAGSYDVPGEQIYNFIINAFVYNDPANSRLFIENGTVRFAPMTEEWRAAMRYLNGLYKDGLIDPFSYDHNTFVSLANDEWDMLGGFASQSVTDVLFQSNPELINNFTHIAPLSGPNGARNATARTPLPRPAGVITSACENPEAVFKLFDLMLSEEAFLIGRYGEEGVDWVPGSVNDIDFYGNNAAVKVLNRLQNTVQNKTIGEVGPFFAYPRFSNSVNFSGFEADQGYVNARAYRVYEQYQPEIYINFTNAQKTDEREALRGPIDDYTTASIRAFITGEEDPSSSEAWLAHLETYRTLGIDRLIASVQEELE